MVVPTSPMPPLGFRQRLQFGPASTATTAPPSAQLNCEGQLRFDGKVSLHSKGVEFKNGHSYQVQLADFEDYGLIGEGRYGKVRKVLHKPTGVCMALKEIRLDSSERGFRQILMELSVLHESSSPYIVEFFGAFFVESFVFYCMELMDAGSLDRHIVLGGFPENVIGKIAFAVLQGLLHMKRTLNIIHRDVRPSNILLDSSGVVKLCDFGVSGELVHSVAKTFVGCQKYMAPERILASSDRPYGVQSDVWSLGVSLIEMALGRFPYSKFEEKSLFNQSLMIVEEPSPSLPDTFSKDICNFVSICLQKQPENRSTLEELLEHPFITSHASTDISSWAQSVIAAADQRKNRTANAIPT